jgi:hypothetical protein
MSELPGLLVLGADEVVVLADWQLALIEGDTD